MASTPAQTMRIFTTTTTVAVARPFALSSSGRRSGTLQAQQHCFSTSTSHRAKEVDPTTASASHAAFEKRRILEELRASSSSSSSSSSSTSSSGSISEQRRKTVNDTILDGDTLRRATAGSGSLAAAAMMGGGGGGGDGSRPSVLDRLTAEDKPWKQLRTGQKIARTTRYSTRVLLVLAGGTFTLAVIYTLGTELFAPNSPTVIYADAITSVKRHDETFLHLLEPLRFMTHPPRNDLTDPSETLLPLPASARSSLRAHKPVVLYSVDRASGREVMQLHFWIVGRERGTELGWFEELRGWSSHQFRQLSAKAQEAWERVRESGDGALDDDGEENGRRKVEESRAEFEREIREARSSGAGSSIGSYLAAPFRAVGSLFGSVTRPSAELGLNGSSPSGGGAGSWSLGSRRSEPGTFTTAEVVAELEKDDAGIFQYRAMFMRIPHDGIMAQRLWIIRKKGEVLRKTSF
ncbi:hypothetical protein V8E36_006939 [Tilletia maclaganii]